MRGREIGSRNNRRSIKHSGWSYEEEVILLVSSSAFLADQTK